MNRVSPAPLKKADEIRIVAVSESIFSLHTNLISKAIDSLSKLELIVTFSAHSNEKTTDRARDISNRVADLHAAFTDPQVKGLLIGLGGVNAIEMLPYIDFDLIRAHPKPICGFSDATIILNAIYSTTGLITYYGPMLFSFVANVDLGYTTDYFRKAVFSKSPYTLIPGTKWGNYNALQSDMINVGYQVIREGNAEGILIGGHVPSFNLLQGTRYLPDLENAILFIEICDRYGKDTVGKLHQYLSALMLQKGADKLKGLLVGRLCKDEAIMPDDIRAVLLSREDMKDIPIIVNVDFGHTTPMITLPIGGRINILNDQMIISEQ